MKEHTGKEVDRDVTMNLRICPLNSPMAKGEASRFLPILEHLIDQSKRAAYKANGKRWHKK